jgi:hypothetical protein
VGSPRAIEGATLSPRALRLLEHVQERACVRQVELRGAGFGSGPELKKLLIELESNVLVHTSSEHTPSGAHEKVLRSWSEWVRVRAFTPTPMTHELASSQLAAAASALSAGTPRSVRFPWAQSPR